MPSKKCSSVPLSTHDVMFRSFLYSEAGARGRGEMRACLTERKTLLFRESVAGAEGDTDLADVKASDTNRIIAICTSKTVKQKLSRLKSATISQSPALTWRPADSANLEATL